MKWFLTGALVGAAAVEAAAGSLIGGSVIWHAAELERRREAGRLIDAMVIGSVVIRDDVSVELAAAVIQRLRVVGSLVGPEPVLTALSGRVMVAGASVPR